MSNKKFPEARKHEERGLHRVLFRFSPEDYTRIGEVWNGPHPEDGEELIVENEIPEGAPWPDLDDEPQLVSPGVDPEMIQYFSRVLGGSERETITTQPRSKRHFAGSVRPVRRR